MDTTELIKEKLDIADFIRGYVQLSPAGKNLKGLCPFHKEKSPSFMVSPERQSWHCFGCGIGGDAISFLMRFENLEFLEALKILADRTGVDLKLTGSSDQKKYDVLYEINRIGKDFFMARLREEAGKTALQYLLNRALTKKTIDEFEIGLAPASSDSLLRHLTKLGYAVTDIERAGLAFKTDRGTYWDRFRNRIMFPIHNHFGKVVGYTGRVMPGNESPEVGKYVNSPETPIFQKSKLLFGFHKSKNNIREAQNAVLVEGQMDFIGVWQDGIKNIVATSGTALTADHLKTLRRLSEQLVIAFDNDTAGRAAAERAIDLGQHSDMNVKVVLYTDPLLKDPADIAKEKPGQMAKLIQVAVPAMEFYFSFYGIGRPLEIAAKKKAVRHALAKIKTIASPVEQAHWISELASRTRIPEFALTAELSTIKIDPITHAVQTPATSPSGKLAAPLSRYEVISQNMLSLALSNQDFFALIEKNINLLPEGYDLIVRAIQTKKETDLPMELKKIYDLVQMHSGLESGDAVQLKKEFDELMVALELESFRRQRARLSAEIKTAEQAGDDVLLARLLGEYHKLNLK